MSHNNYKQIEPEKVNHIEPLQTLQGAPCIDVWHVRVVVVVVVVVINAPDLLYPSKNRTKEIKLQPSTTKAVVVCKCPSKAGLAPDYAL